MPEWDKQIGITITDGINLVQNDGTANIPHDDYDDEDTGKEDQFE